jgi:hypothetical protein
LQKKLEFPQNVIASEAKQSIIAMKNGLLRRFAPRNDKKKLLAMTKKNG